MADNKEQGELESLAFEVFAKGVSVTRRGTEQDALASFRMAEAFLKVRESVRKGGLKAQAEAPLLADCSCPNVSRTHPLNLVSQRFGNLDKVNRVKKWLDANPTPQDDPELLVARLNREFQDLNWDLPTVNVARDVFPIYAKG